MQNLKKILKQITPAKKPVIKRATKKVVDGQTAMKMAKKKVLAVKGLV